MNEDARTILEIVGFFVFLAIVLVIGVASIFKPTPSEVEARDAQIEECLALEKYTLEQCIVIVSDK